MWQVTLWCVSFWKIVDPLISISPLVPLYINLPLPSITDPTPHLLPGWHAQGPEGAHQPTQQQFSSDPMVCTHCRRKLLAWKHLGILNVAVTVCHAKRWKCKGLKIPKMWTQNPKLVKTEHLLEKKMKKCGSLMNPTAKPLTVYSEMSHVWTHAHVDLVLEVSNAPGWGSGLKPAEMDLTSSSATGLLFQRAPSLLQTLIDQNWQNYQRIDNIYDYLYIYM